MDPEKFGLGDERAVAVASELAPELFAALAISSGFDEATFPLESNADLKKALATLVGDDGTAFESPGVRITPDQALDRFPQDFLPVTDRLDLLRKVYMAIVIAHEADSRPRIEALRAGKTKHKASHPFDVGAL